MRILIVDDDAVYLDLLEAVLQELGYEVERAANGRDAFELICRGDFRIVLSDSAL